MIRIYQIGNYRVNLVPSNKQALKEGYPTKFRRPADVLTGVSGDVVYATPGKPLVTAGKWSFEGALICGSSAACESVNQEFNQMIAGGGEVVNIIAAVPPECCLCEQCGGVASCSQCAVMPEAQWLLTCAMVTDYKSDFNWDFGQSPGEGEINVSLTIIGATHWEPLNDVEWSYYGRNKPTYPITVGAVTKRPPPFTPRWNGRLDSGFQKVILDGKTMWDPANWILGYSSSMNRRARAVLTSADYTTPTITVTNPVVSSHVVDIPYSNWPAQPESLYYFTDMPTAGELVLSVETLTPQGQTVTSTATLDMGDLDSNSALSPAGIQATDVVLVGIRGNQLFSMYLQGGTTPVDMYVPWVYSGGYPGETLIGYNTVELDVTDGLNTVEYAYLHTFRRY